MSHGTQCLCMFPLHCNGWEKIYCSWVACRPVNLKSDRICMICLGNLFKHADTLLCLVKKHQSCVLEWSSLILLLWEEWYAMKLKHGTFFFCCCFLSTGHRRSIDSYLFKYVFSRYVTRWQNIAFIVIDCPYVRTY